MVEEEPMKLTKELEDVELLEGDPSKVTKVSGELNLSIKWRIVVFLKEKLDLFTQTHEDMPDIDDRVIEHQLNVDPMKKPIQQKFRVFASERNMAIMEEVEKLLTVGFIREVFYPK